ncbi:hypothetical protein M9H77_17133 [Catharanthus roseus]|uniref:Uncharacterized protein n=1 Tax=Catharanthus roseus TaxID=4058 RepID=A0ACC0B3N9_CATRO|nr:hypothetical protein M9H77_17133 [Catharanthus roseus]
MCFMAMENEVQSSPSNSSSLIDDNCDVDPSFMLIEMYDECKKKKVNDLTLCIERFTQGKENFEKLISSQRSTYDKHGSGYNHSNASSKQTYFVKGSYPSPIFVVVIVVRVVIRPLALLLLRKTGCKIFLRKGHPILKLAIRFFHWKRKIGGCLQNPWWVILKLVIVVDFDYSRFGKSLGVESR